ncbi:NrsF family protein [Methylopila sp. 73B]|uniref:NrsF family protein n=1 Tax=Methylopila sp. 73B TaxID=1120792 RepID=UPI00036FDD39|nr:NrsF family protein [Methylopila sp. 73B]
MKTSALIDALATDAGTPPARLEPAFAAGAAGAVVVAGLLFAATLGVRPDAAVALGAVRFPFKFAVTLAGAVGAAVLALRLARPGASLRPGVVALGVAVALLASGVAAELVATPRDAWASRLVGHNALLCLASVTGLALGPLALLLAALRRGAPASPRAAGAAAGLCAGAIAATFYAAHCVDDSPLFVATWYPLGLGLVSALGAAAGERALRW